MILVILESPFAGKTPADTEANLTYLREAMADCLSREEAPFASHALYTQPGVLDDTKADEREKGVLAGFAWRKHAAKTVVYTDRGLSEGMIRGITHAVEIDHPVEFRSLTMQASVTINLSRGVGKTPVGGEGLPGAGGQTLWHVCDTTGSAHGAGERADTCNLCKTATSERAT